MNLPPVDITDDAFSVFTQYTHNLKLYKNARTAIAEGNIEQLKTILHTFKQEQISQCIVEAAGSNQLSIMNYFLDANNTSFIGDIHYENESPAKNAAKNGSLEILQYLIENHNIDINAPGKIKQLEKMDHSSITVNLYFLLKCLPEEQYDVFLYACANNQVAVIDYLLHAPQTKDKITIDYAHAFNIAAMNGSTEIIEYLLPQAPQDTNYNYAFLLSIGHQRSDVINLLLEKHLVNINVCINYTENPVNEFGIFRYGQQSSYNYSALSIACVYNEKAQVDYFIDKGASLSSHNYLVLHEKLQMEMMHHLIIHHNLDNNKNVQNILHQKYSKDEYDEIMHIFDARDLFKTLEQELPITSSKKPRSKI